VPEHADASNRRADVVQQRRNFWELLGTFAVAKKKMARYDRKDSVYRAAKKAGLRSRAGLKLEDINKRFHIFRGGHKVLDLGCWPGAWLQIAAKAVGDKGRVVGIDLVETSELDSANVFVVTGDVRDSAVIDSAVEALGGSADVVLSDMAPKLTGVRASDQARHLDLAEAAVGVAKAALKPGGVMVLKLFSSVESQMPAQ